MAVKKMEVVIAPKARDDIASILAWTEKNFGTQALSRYAKLIAKAIEQVAENPELVGSHQRPEIAKNCRTNHLYLCRKAAGRARDRVRHPCHFLLYRALEANIVEIGRVRHDSMDLLEHLPEDFRESPKSVSKSCSKSEVAAPPNRRRIHRAARNGVNGTEQRRLNFAENIDLGENVRREPALLTEGKFDLLVIGSGITGAGVAHDAAARGMKVALVDKGDFASATSSASSKLIHGGLRYLEHAQFHLVHESPSERRRLLRNAPHLVKPLRFILPFYRQSRLPR